MVSKSDRKYTEHRVEQMHCVTKIRGGKELYTGSWEYTVFVGYTYLRDMPGKEMAYREGQKEQRPNSWTLLGQKS